MMGPMNKRSGCGRKVRAALALSAFLLAGAGSRNDALANNVSFSENDSWVNHASKDVHVGSINLNNGEWESDGTKNYTIAWATLEGDKDFLREIWTKSPDYTVNFYTNYDGAARVIVAEEDMNVSGVRGDVLLDGSDLANDWKQTNLQMYGKIYAADGYVISIDHFGSLAVNNFFSSSDDHNVNDNVYGHYVAIDDTHDWQWIPNWGCYAYYDSDQNRWVRQMWIRGMHYYRDGIYAYGSGDDSATVVNIGNHFLNVNVKSSLIGAWAHYGYTQDGDWGKTAVLSIGADGMVTDDQGNSVNMNTLNIYGAAQAVHAQRNALLTIGSHDNPIGYIELSNSWKDTPTVGAGWSANSYIYGSAVKIQNQGNFLSPGLDANEQNNGRKLAVSSAFNWITHDDWPYKNAYSHGVENGQYYSGGFSESTVVIEGQKSLVIDGAIEAWSGGKPSGQVGNTSVSINRGDRMLDHALVQIKGEVFTYQQVSGASANVYINLGDGRNFDGDTAVLLEPETKRSFLEGAVIDRGVASYGTSLDMKSNSVWRVALDPGYYADDDGIVNEVDGVDVHSVVRSVSMSDTGLGLPMPVIDMTWNKKLYKNDADTPPFQNIYIHDFTGSGVIKMDIDASTNTNNSDRVYVGTHTGKHLIQLNNVGASDDRADGTVLVSVKSEKNGTFAGAVEEDDGTLRLAEKKELLLGYYLLSSNDSSVSGYAKDWYLKSVQRTPLIWRGSTRIWEQGAPWYLSSPDAELKLDTPQEYVTKFLTGDDVTFNGVGAASPDVTVSGDITAGNVRFTSGDYSFSGAGSVTADSLLIDASLFGPGTKASFDVPVRLNTSLDVGADASAYLKDLTMELNAPASVNGTLELETVSGGAFTVGEGGTLTLSGGGGSLGGLTVNSGATLNVNSLSAYSVSGAFSALGGSVTNFNFSDWAAGSGWGIHGGSSASLGEGALLTVSGIANGATGTWTLLSGFENIEAGEGAWTYKHNSTDSTLTIAGRDDLDDYIVAVEAAGGAYTLSITRPDGDLIWNGTGSDIWSANSESRPWLIAQSADLDEPMKHEERTFADSFTDGKIVTFNSIGEKQQTVTVDGDVSAKEVRVTAGTYQFIGDGRITADRLTTDDSKFGTGTAARFEAPVTVNGLLGIGADTEALLKDLTMELNAPASVNGTLELETVSGGAFTVGEGGTLTLSGGGGSLGGLTVNSGATLNVNSLSAYSVSGAFSALGGSVTNFNFSDWAAGSGWGIQGGSSASLGGGATLTISGIKQGATGTWTLLSGFESITADGWSTGDITIKNYDLSGYTVRAYAEGNDYLLEITKKEEPTPDPDPEPEPKPDPDPEPEPDPKPEPKPEPEPEPEPDPQPANAHPGHTEAYHIATSVQNNVSAAAESASMGLLGLEPSPERMLWARLWRENTRVYSGASALALKNRAYGIVVGRDLSRNSARTWGLAAHIGKADTSGKGMWDGSTSDTDFWGVLLYGRRETGKWLFTGDVGVTWLKTDYTDGGGAKADNAKASMLSAGGRAYYKWVENTAPGKMNISPFVGLRWNRYRQSGYSYDSGDYSAAYTADQFLVPLGVKFSWNESVSKKGWRTAPSFEVSYIRTLGDRSARTGIFSKGSAARSVNTPLADSDTFGAKARFSAKRKNFQWDVDAGVRHGSSVTDFSFGATFKWEL